MASQTVLNQVLLLLQSIVSSEDKKPNWKLVGTFIFRFFQQSLFSSYSFKIFDFYYFEKKQNTGLTFSFKFDSRKPIIFRNLRRGYQLAISFLITTKCSTLTIPWFVRQ